MTNGIEDTVTTYLTRYNSGDVEGILSLFADDATVEDPVGTAPRVGKLAIREFVTEAVGYRARLEGPKPLLVCGNEAAFGFQAYLGAGEARTGLKVIDTIEVNARGLIVRLRAYLNPSELEMALEQDEARPASARGA